MKIFWKYFFPPLYGLLVYFTIRLLTDSVSGMKFWYRPLFLNAIEITTSILMGYLLIGAFNRLIRYFDKKIESGFSYKIILKELLYVFIINQVVQNIVLTPMAAFTDDGLQSFDIIDINIIPLLYCLIYYGVRRSNAFLQAYINNRLQLEKITNDQLQTELKFLRAQYHPHFLFNALNTIYFQMDIDVQAAKKTVERFSELLRYQLYDQQQMVSVINEIQYLQNFIALQKIRSSRRLQLEVIFDEALHNEQVYPLLFLPLVENAFKYVGGDFHIHIYLKKHGDEISFYVENSIPDKISFEAKGGIGLDNLKRRLELLYPGKHSFTAQVKENSFLAELKLATR
ncbi:sensor histidine kinase [Chitinophaga sp.]|uniref:sensor histidine kinase n=1 Tax=Chitinophaga sp. TaxID=1869181 RepID=UPI002BA3EE64|nr:histidine kinase [Chitinophaga sp.]HWV67622.1 histidine kinase [Chitinophaga sp.]